MSPLVNPYDEDGTPECRVNMPMDNSVDPDPQTGSRS